MVNNQYNQIEFLISIGKYSQVLELFKSLEITRTLSDDESLLKMYVQVFIYLDKGDFQKGVDLADKMIKQSKNQNNSLREIDAILGKIENSICLGLFNESFDLINNGEILLKKLNNQSSESIKKRDAYLKFLKGRIYNEKYDMFNAVEYFEKSYVLRKEIGDKFGLIFSLLNLGVTTGSIGNMKENREYSKQSLSLAEELKVEMGVIWNLINLGGIAYHLRDLNDAVSYAERCLRICEPKEYKHSCTLCYDIIGHSLFEKGDLDKALQYFKKSLDYRLKTGFKNLIAQSYYNIGRIYNQKGELQRSLEYLNKIFKIPEVQEDQRSRPAYLTSIGKIYGELGDFTTAKKYLFEALDLLKDVKVHIFYFLNFKVNKSKIYHYLIQFSINNNEFDKLDHYLNELFQLSKENPELKQIEQLYRLNKAIILKSSNRLMDKMEAGIIFREIAEEEILDHGITVEAMTNLCDVLIKELELTGEKNILEVIEELSDELLSLSKNQHLHHVLAETYFFKAKLSLLHLDIENTRLFLTKAQNTANKYGLWRLASKLSDDHDSLLVHMDKWEEKIKQNIPLQQRLGNISYDFLFSKMVRTNIDMISKESEIPVYFLIFEMNVKECIYIKSFQDKNVDDKSVLKNFISYIKTLKKEIFRSSDSIDRYKHGDNLMIINLKENFIFAYVFRGKSYFAISRFNNFIEILEISTINFKKISTSIHKNNNLSEEVLQIIDQLVERIFILNIII